MTSDGIGDDIETNATGSIFVVEVLSIIKDCQQQHGLRHGDFHRYRQYVTRKLRRMRKSLHFPKGNKYRVQPKKVTQELLICDQRYLIMMVFEVERAWAYAMQLKPESNTEPRKKFHMISRFKKAVALADEIVALSNASCCDARTKLECQAYASWMRGNFLFELQQYSDAKEALSSAQTIYSRLADLLEEGQRHIYSERVRELEPQLRYCLFETEGDTSAVEALKAMRAAAGTGAIATEQLDHLLAQTRADVAASVVEVSWLSHLIAVRLEKPRIIVSSLKDWESELQSTSESESKMSIFETILKECTEALQTVRDEIRGVGVGGDLQSSVSANLQLLQQYLQYVKLTKTAERNIALINVNRSRSPQELARLYDSIVQHLQEIRILPALSGEYQLQDFGQLQNPEVMEDLHSMIEKVYNGDTESQAKAVAQYSMYKEKKGLFGRSTSLAAALVMPAHSWWKMYGAAVPELQKVAVRVLAQSELDGKILGFRAYRCYNLSKSYQSVKKFTECFSLLQRALQHCHHAVEILSTINEKEVKGVELTSEELEELIRDVEAETYACRAAKLIDTVSVGTTEDKVPKDTLKKPLIERLEIYVEDPILSSSRRNLTHGQPLISLPPDFEPIPAKPVFFDLANNHIDFPNLDDMIKSSNAASSGTGGGLTGFVKGWMGWGSGKK